MRRIATIVATATTAVAVAGVAVAPAADAAVRGWSANSVDHVSVSGTYNRGPNGVTVRNTMHDGLGPRYEPCLTLIAVNINNRTQTTTECATHGGGAYVGASRFTFKAHLYAGIVVVLKKHPRVVVAKDKLKKLY